MTYYYSSRKLFRRFLFRFAPSIVFLFLALLFGYEFWIAVFLLWAEAVIEVLVMKKRGYFKMEETEIKSLSLFNPVKIKFEDILRIYTYDSEWTYRTRTKELRILLSNIRQDQQEAFVQVQEHIRKAKSHGKS